MTAQEPLPLGVVARPHGLRGELRVHLHDPGSETLFALARVVVRQPGRPDRMLAVESARPAPGLDATLLALAGVDERDAAEALRGAEICALREDLPAPADDEVYVADLVGCEAFDLQGRPLGRVASTFATAAHDVLVLHDEAARVERLVPAVPEVVVDADVEGRRLVLHLPEGLPEEPLP